MSGAVGRLAVRRGVIKMRLAAAGGAVALAVAGIVPSALGASAAASPGANGPQRTGGFVIHRSAFGVPTITAGSQGQMWFGAGWAQAQDRMVQLELTRRAVEVLRFDTRDGFRSGLSVGRASVRHPGRTGQAPATTNKEWR